MRLQLKTELLKQGRSQRELAAFMGRHPSYVSRLIRDHQRLRARDCRLIAEFLELPVSALFPGALRNSAKSLRKKDREQQ